MQTWKHCNSKLNKDQNSTQTGTKNKQWLLSANSLKTVSQSPALSLPLTPESPQSCSGYPGHLPQNIPHFSEHISSTWPAVVSEHWVTNLDQACAKPFSLQLGAFQCWGTTFHAAVSWDTEIKNNCKVPSPGSRVGVAPCQSPTPLSMQELEWQYEVLHYCGGVKTTCFSTSPASSCKSFLWVIQEHDSTPLFSLSHHVGGNGLGALHVHRRKLSTLFFDTSAVEGLLWAWLILLLPLCRLLFSLWIKCSNPCLVASHDLVQHGWVLLKGCQIHLTECLACPLHFICEYTWHKLGTDLVQTEIFAQNLMDCCVVHPRPLS